MKILFCNIKWMKEYRGINENDEINPTTKGSSKKTRNAEQYNFLNIDGYYYGYVSTKAGGKKKAELLLENIYPESKGKESIDDVLVIWLAKRPNEKAGHRIVGWYKKARVYKNYRENSLGIYNIKANVRDCLLIPPIYRTYLIYPAKMIGIEKGLGESNIWCPRGENAREVMENCINYINNYSYERFDEHITEEQLNFITKDKLDTLECYVKKGEELLNINPLKTVQYCNKLINEKGDDLTALYNKAIGLENLRFYTKAREVLGHILEKDEQYGEAKVRFDNINKVIKQMEEVS